MLNIPIFDKKEKKSIEFSNLLLTRFKEQNPILFNDFTLNEFEKESINYYIKELYITLEKTARKEKNYDKFSDQYKLFKQSYSITLRWSVYEKYVDFLLSIEKKEEALTEWILLQEEEWEGFNRQFSYRDQAIERLIRFEKILKRSIINGYFIDKIAPKENQLTEFGKKNKQDVLKIVETIIKTIYNNNFFECVYKDYSYHDNYKRQTFQMTHYEDFFNISKSAKKTFDWFNSNEGMKIRKSINKDGTVSQDFARTALRYKAASIMREAENELRMNIGAKQIGESWISETELYYKIKCAFPDLKVIHHGKPDWLGRQHFDIWIPEIRCAIEYQGVQHDKPINFFGGETGHKNNIIRDSKKRQKSIENNVFLIEVRPNYDFEKIVNEIKSCISEIYNT